MNKKKIAVIIGAVVLVGGIGSVAFARYHSVSDTPKEMVTTETEEVVNIDYLKYVKGLKDWTVEQNTTPNFMDSVEWDKAYISAVTCDSAEVDMATVGTYEINYSVVPLRDNELKVSKTVKVEVVAPEKADELASQGKEVVTDEGIKNKAVAKASSMTDKGVAVKDKNNKKVEVKKDSKGNVTGTVTTTKPVPTPSKPKDTPALHFHSWEDITQTVNHKEEGHNERVKVKDAWTEKVCTKQAWSEKVTVKEAWVEKIKTKDAWSEQVKVSDAYTKPIYEGHYICNNCNKYVDTVQDRWDHSDLHGVTKFSYRSEKVKVGEETIPAQYKTVNHPAEYKEINHPAEYKTVNHPAEYKNVNHPAEYKDKWVVDKKAWTETKVVGKKCSSCGATK